MYREYILNTGILANSENPTFVISPPERCYAFRVVSVSFIQNWDSTNDANNTIAFAEDGDSSPRLAKISPGSYTSSSIITAIADALTSAGTQSYNVVYDDITRRLTVSTTGGKSFKLLGADRGSTAYLQLGLSKTNETGYGMEFVLPSPLNLSASAPILLTSRTLQAGNALTYVSGINSDMNVLACITPDAYNDVISWSNPSDKMFPTGELSLSNIDLQLVDSASLQQIKTNAPIVVVLGVNDDFGDFFSP